MCNGINEVMMQVAELEVGASGSETRQRRGWQRQGGHYELVGMCPARRANAAAKRCRDMGQSRNRDRNDVACRGLLDRIEERLRLVGERARPDESK